MSPFKYSIGATISTDEPKIDSDGSRRSAGSARRLDLKGCALKVAPDWIGRGKQRKVNARFSAMVGRFLFEAEFCNPASGWEKGQIEKNVQDARPRICQPTPNFPSLTALNERRGV